MKIKIFSTDQEDALNKFLGETYIISIDYQPSYIVVLYENNYFLKQKLEEAKNNLINNQIQLKTWETKRDQKRGGIEAQQEYSSKVLQAERQVEESKLIITKIEEML